MSGSAGKTKISIDTAALGDGESIAAYLVTASGDLVTSSTVGGFVFAHSYDASTHGDSSTYAPGVDYLSSMGVVDNAGNWVPFTLNASGELPVAASITLAASHLEDSAFTDGDAGLASLLVRQDTLAASTTTDGDYGSFKSNNLGELYVFDTTTHTTLTSILADTATIDSQTLSIQNTLTALSKAEDAAHVSGDQGIQMLAVRNDAGTSLVSADGDYASLQLTASGALRVDAGTVVANIEGDYAEDSAHVSGDRGLFQLSVRNDNQATTFASATGDYQPYATDQKGALYVKDVDNAAILQSVVAVNDTTATALPTTALTNRTGMMVQMLNSGTVYIGSATVTNSGATRGFSLSGNGSFVSMDVGPSVGVFGISASGTGSKDMAILQFS